MALQGFDEQYYLNAKLASLQADSVTASGWAGKASAYLMTILSNFGLTPTSHYQMYGYKEGLSPNAYFNADEYSMAKAQQLLDQGTYDTPDDAMTAFETAWQSDPYLHYLEYGSAEGINPSNSFDESLYYEAKLTALQADSATSATWTGKTIADLKSLFDANSFTPLSHYMAYGAFEGLVVSDVPANEQVSTTQNTSPLSQTNPGRTFSLTSGLNVFTATAKDDTLSGASGTISAQDSFSDIYTTDVDIANLVIDKVIGAITLQNIEIVNLSYAVATCASIDAANMNGSKFVNISSSTAGLSSADIAGLTGGINIVLDEDITDFDVEGTASISDSAVITVNSASAVITNGGADIDGDTVTDVVENLKIIAGSASTLTLDQATALNTLLVSGSNNITITGAQVASNLVSGKAFNAAMSGSANATLAFTTTADDIDLTSIRGFTFSILDNTANGNKFTFASGDVDLALSANINQGVTVASAFYAAGTTNTATVSLYSGGNDSLNFDGFAIVTLDSGSAATTVSAVSVESNISDGTKGALVVTGDKALTIEGIAAGSLSATTMTAALSATLSATCTTVTGGTVNDTFTAYDGDMAINGGNGNDIFSVEALDLSDNTISLSSVEIITLTGDAIFAGSQMNGKTFTIIDNANALTINGTSAATGENINLGNIVILDGTLEAGLSVNGTAFNDILTGASTAQTISGLEGNDQITGGKGNDTIDGGPGSDTLTGGDGSDGITGGSGADLIVLTEEVAAIDTIVTTGGFDAMDTVKGFLAGNGGDIINIDNSDLEGNVGGVIDLIFAGDAASMDQSLTSAVIYNVTGGVDLGTISDASMLNISGTYTSTDGLETALETGGARSLITNNSWEAGDAIPVAYSIGADVYIASVATTAGAPDNAAFASGDLTVTNLIQLSGITDVTDIIAANINFV